MNKKEGSKIFEYIVMSLEILLVLLTSIFTLISLLWFALSMYHDLMDLKSLDKTKVVELLDIALLTLIIIDVLQIVIARYTSTYEYLRVAVEVGMLAMLRELISVEIKKPDPWKIVSIGIVVFILFVVWIGLSRSKVIEALEKRLGKVA
ncbi:phosphate-starvation-inducible PsiE family protein [Ignicoccus islandicus]|uniref:phosphate-starvation-inducible PsiE family protein n=1 Tax=Ignicoccus islandicus TaxID=54259 RepID=UPI0009464DB9|nr:phosphate-starvation-inducible PsiE family protein [Ignicoccus islandicus]